MPMPLQMYFIPLKVALALKIFQQKVTLLLKKFQLKVTLVFCIQRRDERILGNFLKTFQGKG